MDICDNDDGGCKEWEMWWLRNEYGEFGWKNDYVSEEDVC